MDNNQYICGKQIRTRRKALGLTQAQLADMVFVSNKAVSKWETGEANPDITLLPHLAKALHTTTDELLGVPEEEKPVPVAVNAQKRLAIINRIKYAMLVCLAVVVAGFAFLFLVSAMMAFDREEVLKITGDASEQLFLIIFSTVMLGVCVWLLILIYQKSRQYGLAYSYQYDSEIRKRCAEKGFVIYGDLPKEKQKQLVKEFWKIVNPYLILILALVGVMLVSSMVVEPYAPPIGRGIYLTAWIVDCVFLLMLYRRRRKFFLSKKIYFKGKI